MYSLLETTDYLSLSIVYKDVKCSFIPDSNACFSELPDNIKGKVLYLESGEYNPTGWYKEIIVKKKDIIKY